MNIKETRKQLQVFYGTHLFIEICLLKANANIPLYPINILGNVHTQQRCPSGFGLELSRQHLNDSRLTSAILTIDETQRMVDEMFQAEKEYLKGFK